MAVCHGFFVVLLENLLPFSELGKLNGKIDNTPIQENGCQIAAVFLDMNNIPFHFPLPKYVSHNQKNSCCKPGEWICKADTRITVWFGCKQDYNIAAY